jgi:RimJ/RimL family protein N-acetyltransferase
VLLALGVKQEGLLRQRLRKWGRFEDVSVYSILIGDAGRG